MSVRIYASYVLETGNKFNLFCMTNLQQQIHSEREILLEIYAS